MPIVAVSRGREWRERGGERERERETERERQRERETERERRERERDSHTQHIPTKYYTKYGKG